MHTLLYSVPQPYNRLPQHTSAGVSWTLTSKSGSVSSGVTAPFSRVLMHTGFCFCPPRACFPRPVLSSGSSMVGLMVTFSKRAYAKPKSAAPRASASAAVHCWPIPPQEMLKHSSVSVSVGSLGSGVHKVCLSPLSISGGYGVWF